MTLIIGLKATDGIVLAGDSRGTFGDPASLTAINDNYKKIYRLSDYCGIGFAGSSELGAALLDRVDKEIARNKIQYIDEVLNFIRGHFRKKYNDWFEKVPFGNRPHVLFVLCGYRKIGEEKPEPMIYMLASNLDFAPQLNTSGYSMVGIPQYAVYLSNRYFNQKMNKDEACALIEFLIFETATQDPKVGGPINIAEITLKDGYIELSDEQVKEVRIANEKQSKELQKFFFARKD